jgi:hypothetical protein
MRLSLTKLENIPLTITTNLQMSSPLCLLLPVRPVGSVVNLYTFYFNKIIGKLTTFLQLQEFKGNTTVTSSNTGFWVRLQHY